MIYLRLFFISIICVFIMSCAAKQIEQPPPPEPKPEPIVEEKPKLFVEAIVKEAALFLIPDEQSQPVGVLLKGDLAEVVDIQEKWLQVTTPDHPVAWVLGEQVAVPAAHDIGSEEWMPIGGSRPHLQADVDGLNVRSQGTIQSETVDSVIKNTNLFITDKKGDWYAVKLPDGTPGWVCDKFVKPYQAGLDPELGKWFKTRGDCPMYAGAGEDREKIRTVWALKKVAKMNQQNDWYEVQLEDGTTGWIHKKHLKQLK
ncbi:MAG: hypothetical protein B6244_11850 [Candidatus Cloacimonetes bacterium 4572_55]|nr:MAG: hypothetical protein B6244_11850 [Candidatus Cloacimonetes bacterium 4572_55]